MSLHYTKGAQGGADPFEFVLSDESVDRVGDIIEAKGWDLSDFRKNPVALFGHAHDKPIGVWEKVRVEGKRLLGRLKLAAEGTSAEIDTLRKLVEQRILKAVSVGFAPIEMEENAATGGYRFKKQALHEVSLVSVPANANALSLAKAAGADRRLIKTLFSDLDAKGQIAAPGDEVRKTLMRQVERSLARIEAKL